MKQYIVVALLLSCLIACNRSNYYKIEGHIDETTLPTDDLVFLVDAFTFDVIDSAPINKGKFVFSGEVDTPFVATILAPNSDINVIVEKGTIDVNIDKLTISGTRLNDKLNELEYGASYQLCQNMWKQMISDTNSQHRDEISQALDYMEYKKNIDRYYNLRQTLINGENNILGVYSLMMIIAGSEELLWDFPITADTIENLANMAGDFVVSNFYIHNRISTLRNKERTLEGGYFVDFEVINLKNGEPTKLSEKLNAPLTLVDFWASWCFPCCRYIENDIIRVYKKYHSKGLNVIGVAVWDKIPDAQAKSKKLKIPYTEVIDTNDCVPKCYGFKAIPVFLLIDDNGKIILRSDGSDGFGEVERKIKNVLS